MSDTTRHDQTFVIPVPVELEDADSPITVDQLRDFLREAAIIDLDTESVGMAPEEAGDDAHVTLSFCRDQLRPEA